MITKYFVAACKLILFTSLFISFTSCSSSQLKPNDLIFTKEIYYQSPKKLLNEKEIHKDLNLLIYALENGYGAKDHLPGDQFDQAVSSLNKIKDYKKLSGKQFCKLVGDALWPVQDGHLYVLARGKYCGLQQKRREWKGRVGKNWAYNDYKEDNRPWHMKSIIKNGKRIGMISIIYYPSHKDTKWNGFIEQSKNLIKSSDVLVVDLRGNQGGDDTKGFELASILQDRVVKPGWDKTIDRLTPETLALSQNSWLMNKYSFEHKNKQIPSYIENFIKERKEILQNALDGKYQKTKVYSWDQSKYPIGKNAYQGKIFLLQDKECRSSGESSLEVLAKHPNATTLGENTLGMYHFGNVNKLVLPNSKLLIGIASKYNAYSDDRNIDKIGMKPNIVIPKDEDALEYVLKNKI
ncbi:S41 family peptidase [Halobacteriovorax sp. GFR7]|uniref:S41 family peptidase n=1 Tax=unclassified Halobacteriovorax TaxID=2639665 RepID=UPI003D96CBD6